MSETTFHRTQRAHPAASGAKSSLVFVTSPCKSLLSSAPTISMRRASRRLYHFIYSADNSTPPHNPTARQRGPPLTPTTERFSTSGSLNEPSPRSHFYSLPSQQVRALFQNPKPSKIKVNVPNLIQNSTMQLLCPNSCMPSSFLWQYCAPSDWRPQFKGSKSKEVSDILISIHCQTTMINPLDELGSSMKPIPDKYISLPSQPPPSIEEAAVISQVVGPISKKIIGSRTGQKYTKKSNQHFSAPTEPVREKPNLIGTNSSLELKNKLANFS